jgi:transposase-like protein
MDTRLATNQIRLANWASIIQARNESGLTIKEYCSQNGLTTGAYFYWLRKLRTAALESDGCRFVELSTPDPGLDEAATHAADSVTVELGNARIHVPALSVRDTFAMIVEVLRYAE